MNIKLPLIGNIRTGKHAEDIQMPAVISIDKDEFETEKAYDVIGGLLSISRLNLSGEKSISTKLLEANKEWVYRNNDVIAQEVSGIEFELFSVGLQGGEIKYTQIDDHPLLDLLDRFNPRTTRVDGLYTTQSHKKLTGDAFWLLDKNGNTVENIYILPPDKIEIILANPTSATDDFVTGYKYEDVIDGKRIEKIYSADEVIHFKKPNPRNPFRGLGAVEALADTIDADNITNEVQRSFFEKGAISNFVLTTDSNITQDQLKRLRAELRAMYGGARNAFNTMIFGNGLKPADIGFSNKDMEFLSLLEWYRDKIMIGFGNTKPSLGVVDDVNRASFEGSRASWLNGTVKPDMTSIVSTINEFLVPMFGKNLILGYKDPVPQSVTDDIAEAVQLKNAGIIMINEAREKVGFDPIPGGDMFAPNLGMTYPGDTGTKPTDPSTTTENKPKDKPPTKSYRRDKSLPASLSHWDIQPLLRKRSIYFNLKMNKQIKEAAKPLIRASLASNKSEPQHNLSSQLTDDQVNGYYDRQTKIVKVFEEQFTKKVLDLLEEVEKQTLANLDGEIKTVRRLKNFVKNKELFDKEELKTQAQLDLTPILIAELTLAGQEAYDLINIEDTYVPFKAQESIRSMVDKFAESMLDTDKDVLTNIINDGIENGSSIPEIRDEITSKFGDYTKTQATRIARTETARVSNLAAEDAFIQSGVVEAKQWLLASNPCPLCVPHGGKIIKLGSDFYEPDDSGFQDGNPPLHVNCACKIIPIVEGVKAYRPDNSQQVEGLVQRIAELESKLDKRTKKTKEILAQRSEDEVYIKVLEKHLDLTDD